MENYYQKILKAGESSPRSPPERDDAPKQRCVELELNNLDSLLLYIAKKRFNEVTNDVIMK